MKGKLVLGSLASVLLLGFLHVWINVGFDRFGRGISFLFGAQRARLVVGYLPVT